MQRGERAHRCCFEKRSAFEIGGEHVGVGAPFGHRKIRGSPADSAGAEVARYRNRTAAHDVTAHARRIRGLAVESAIRRTNVATIRGADPTPRVEEMDARRKPARQVLRRPTLCGPIDGAEEDLLHRRNAAVLRRRIRLGMWNVPGTTDDAERQSQRHRQRAPKSARQSRLFRDEARRRGEMLGLALQEVARQGSSVGPPPTCRKDEISRRRPLFLRIL